AAGPPPARSPDRRETRIKLERRKAFRADYSSKQVNNFHETTKQAPKSPTRIKLAKSRLRNTRFDTSVSPMRSNNLQRQR
ncbi:hypothetical protein, partial [Herbaspirillum sp. UBA812]|uniref:hypothetical protein n=1 Tax=Herbaspirillum sp. UBA812 TaxID=1946590 RepID=UPI00257DE34E